MSKLPSSAQAQDLAQTLKTLAHPQRLLMLCYLSEGRLSVSELEEKTGASQSAVSQFLGRMKAERLVTSERDQQNVYYEIADPKIKRLIRSLYKIYCEP